MAEIIGHSFGSGRQRQLIAGIGVRPVMAERHRCSVEIRETAYESNFFVIDNKQLPYGLLGQKGFFDRFKVEFDQKKELLRRS
jgi:hypothetical protein